jgi:hypothetical protein
MVFKLSEKHRVLIVNCVLNLLNCPFKGRGRLTKSVLLLSFVAYLPHCCPQRRTFFRVVAHNAEKCSTLLPTTVIIFPHCRQQRRKCSNSGSCMFICAVAHNAGYFSALWTTVRKNDNEIHHRMVAVVYNNAEKS